jgi:hypothetical protein
MIISLIKVKIDSPAETDEVASLVCWELLTPFSKEAERQREGNQKRDILDMAIQQRRPGGIKMVRDGRNVLNFVCFCECRRAATPTMVLQKRAKV